MIPQKFNPPKIMFIIAQILYQSSWYCYVNLASFATKPLIPSSSASLSSPALGQGEGQSDPNFFRFWIHSIIEILPYEIGNFIMFSLMLITICGWVKFLLFRKPSFLLELVHYIGLPLAFLLIPQTSIQNITVNLILWRLVPVTLLTISVCLKINSLYLLHTESSLNKLAPFNKYYPFVPVLRLVFIIIANIFLISQVYIYLFVLALFQIILTFFQCYHILYYAPEIEWCSIMGTCWGWAALIQITLLNLGFMEAKYVDFFVFVVFWASIFVNRGLVKIMQKKIDHIFNRIQKEKKKNYAVILLPYYIAVKHGEGLFSNQFSQRIQFRLRQKYKPSTTATSGNNIEILPKQSKAERSRGGSRTTEYSSCNTPIRNQSTASQKAPRTIQLFLKQRRVFLNIHQYAFRDLFYLIYILADSEEVGLVALHQYYYCLLQYQDNKASIFFRICMQNLYGNLRKRISSEQHMGTHISRIMCYDQMHSLFSKYLSNQKHFISLMTNFEPSRPQYRKYLHEKLQIKNRIKQCLHLLLFNNKVSQTLVSKMYIIDYYIMNNDVLSRENFAKNMLKVSSNHTAIIRFDRKNFDQEQAVFLCGWHSGRVDQVQYYNKKFCADVGVEGGQKLRLQDLLPAYWREQHDQQIRRMQQLQLLPTHSSNTSSLTHYIQCPSSNRIVQAINLRTVPYFQLNNSLMILTRMKIQKNIEITIKPISAQIEERQKEKEKENNDEAMSGTINNKTSMQQRWKRQLSFFHEVYEDQDKNTVEKRERRVQIFGRKYQVFLKNMQFQIFTRNQIKSNMAINMNEEINIIIKMNTMESENRAEIFERSKKHADLLSELSCPMLTKIFILCLILIIVSILVITMSRSTVFSLMKVGSFQVQYHKVCQTLTSFYKIFISYNCNPILSSQPDTIELLDDDTKYIRQIYDNYLQIISQLASDPLFIQPVFSVYPSISINPYPTNNSIMQHITFMNMLTDSTLDLVKAGKCSSLIIKTLKTILSFQVGGLFDDRVYLEAVVLKKTTDVVQNIINQSSICFWFSLVVILSTPLLAMYVLEVAKKKITKSLTQPMQMTPYQLKLMQENVRNFSSFLSKQLVKNNSTNGTNITEYPDTFREEIKMDGQNQPFMEQSRTQPLKKHQGNFEDHRLLLFAFVPLYLFIIVIFGLKFYLAKDAFIGALIPKISVLTEFSRFNANLFTMFNQILDLATQPSSYSTASKQAVLSSIEQMRRSISKFDITKTVESMMFNQNSTAKILYEIMSKEGNENNIPYPVLISWFMTNFNQLFSYISSNYTTLDLSTDEQLVILTTSTYKSLRELKINLQQINQLNISAIRDIGNWGILWIGLFLASSLLLSVLLIGKAVSMVIHGTRHGREVLGMLNSKYMLDSRTFSYEVNSIWHRINFAKNLLII